MGIPIDVCIDDHGLINPANFPCKSADLDTSTITGSADAVTALGTDVKDAADDASTAWQGLQAPGVFETPDHEAVCALMKPAVSGAKTMKGVTSRVGKALTTYAEEVETIKPDLAAFETRAAAFRTRALQGYVVTNLEAHGWAAYATDYGPMGMPANLIGTSADPNAKTTIDWNEHGPAIDKNKAMLSEYNQLIERISRAATTCATAIQGELTLVCAAPPQTITAEMLDANPDFSTWGQPTNEKRNCSESINHGAGEFWHNTWTSAASLIGRDAVTGDWSLQTSLNSLLGVGDFVLSTVIVVTPGLNIAAAAYAANSDSEFANFLDDRFNVAIGSWGGMIGWDQQAFLAGENGWHKWEEDWVSALTESGLNIGTLFIPGAGVAGGLAKTGLRATRVGSFVVKVGHGLQMAIPGGSHLLAGAVRVVDFSVDGIKAGWQKLVDLTPRLTGRHPDVPDLNLPDAPGPSRVPDHTPVSEALGLDRPAGPDTPTARPPAPDAPEVPDTAPRGEPRGTDGYTAPDPYKADPQHVSSTPMETDLNNRPLTAYDQTVADRIDAADAHATNRTELAEARAEVERYGLTIPEKGLNKANIEKTVVDLTQEVKNDPTLTPRERAERLDAIDELGEAALDERASNRTLVKASEAMGDQAARDAIIAQDAKIVVDGQGAPAGSFDQVGLTNDGSTMIFGEAKGGTADLNPRGREVQPGIRAGQGSTEYFNDVFRRDKALQRYLKDNPEIAQGLANGDIQVKYQLIKADVDGNVSVYDLPLDSAHLNLEFPE